MLSTKGDSGRSCRPKIRGIAKKNKMSSAKSGKTKIMGSLGTREEGEKGGKGEISSWSNKIVYIWYGKVLSRL